jgi:hypothetical protein
MAKHKSVEESGVSRRSLIQGAAVAAAIASTGMFVACNTDEKNPASSNTEEKKLSSPEVLKPAALAARTPFCYGKPGSTSNCNVFMDINEDTTKTIYPLLAVWLLMTTNPKLPQDANKIGQMIGLCPGCVQKILNKQDTFSFAGAQNAFASIVHDFSYTASNYSGGDCPNNPATLYAVAGLMP